MKKLILVFCLPLLSTVYVNAQTSQGNMMVGGSLSFTSNSFQANSDYQESDFAFEPSFGYFISDNLAVGLQLGIGTGTTDNGATKTVRNSFDLGPFARYYKFTSNEKFAFFGQAQFLIGGDRRDDTPGGETKSSTMRFQIAPGFSYFFTERWALELSITGLVIQSYDPNKDNDNDKTTTVHLGISSLSPNFGLRYHFGN